MKKEFILAIDNNYVEEAYLTRTVKVNADGTREQEHIVGMGLTEGFAPRNRVYLTGWLRSAANWLHLAQRHNLEYVESTAFRQILPYTVVAFYDFEKKEIVGLMNYQRGKGTGEARLAGDWSIGGGGHIDYPDVVWEEDHKGIDLGATLVDALTREMIEEFKITTDKGEVISSIYDFAKLPVEFYGFIRDDSNDVGKVHLAFVNVIMVPHTWTVTSNEPAIIMGEPATPEILLSRGLKFENWSQILLEEFAQVGRLIPITDVKPELGESEIQEPSAGIDYDSLNVVFNGFRNVKVSVNGDLARTYELDFTAKPELRVLEFMLTALAGRSRDKDLFITLKLLADDDAQMKEFGKIIRSLSDVRGVSFRVEDGFGFRASPSDFGPANVERIFKAIYDVKNAAYFTDPKFQTQ